MEPGKQTVKEYGKALAYNQEEKGRRFFRMVLCLPTELRMLVCNRCAGIQADFLPADLIKKGLQFHFSLYFEQKI